MAVTLSFSSLQKARDAEARAISSSRTRRLRALRTSARRADAADDAVHVNRKGGSEMLEHQFAFVRLRLHQALIDDDCRELLLTKFGDRGLQRGGNFASVVSL